MRRSSRHDLVLVLPGLAGDEPRRALGRVVAVVPLVIGGGLVVDDEVRLGGDRVQVLGQRGTIHRREEVVGQDEPVGVRPVVRDPVAIEIGVPGHVGAVQVGVLRLRDRAVHPVEAVHLAAVDRREAAAEAVRQVVRIDVGPLGEPDDRAVVAPVLGAPDRAALGRTVGTRVRREVVVERPVLLDDEHDVLDRRLAGDDRLAAVARGAAGARSAARTGRGWVAPDGPVDGALVRRPGSRPIPSAAMTTTTRRGTPRTLDAARPAVGRAATAPVGIGTRDPGPDGSLMAG